MLGLLKYFFAEGDEFVRGEEQPMEEATVFIKGFLMICVFSDKNILITTYYFKDLLIFIFLKNRKAFLKKKDLYYKLIFLAIFLCFVSDFTSILNGG